MGDHFSQQAAAYSVYRPTYPIELFHYLASLTADKNLAWDCACGSGQAAIVLAKYYDVVLATDISVKQLENAVSANNLFYMACKAEGVALRDNSVDLMCVAQAAHWFDHERFYAEVNRVLKPNGVLALWSYSLMYIANDIDDIVSYFYREIVGEFWPPERKYIEDEYRSLPFPLAELKTPQFTMELNWTFEHLLGYLQTWSATQYYKNTLKRDPIDLIRQQLLAAWGDPAQERRVVWPFFLRVGRSASPST